MPSSTTYAPLVISNDAVGAAQISAGAVGTSELEDLGVATGDIAANAVTNAKLATMAARTVKANITASTAVPTDVTGGDITTLIGKNGYGPTGTLAETLQRNLANASSQAAYTSGSLRLQAIYLPSGITVTNIGIRTGSTATTGPTHQWVALYSSARARLAVSADATNTAMTASTNLLYAMQVAYPVTTPGLYYIGVLITSSGSICTSGGFTATATSITTPAPILGGITTDTGLDGTSAPPDPAGAITSIDLLTPYMWVT